MNRTFKILNLLSVLLAIAANYYFNSPLYGGKTVGEVSAQYDNLFTPAGYAFSIWGIIYLGLLAFSVFQFRKLGDSSMTGSTLKGMGLWLVLANLSSIFWLWVWLSGLIGLSLLLMLSILVCLGRAFVAAKVGTWDAPKATIAFFWWPLMLYFGWITVATVANTAAFGVYLGWDGTPLSPELWTMAVIVVATGIYTFVVWNTNARMYGLVSVWAFTAIAYRQLEAYPIIGWTALAASAFILLIVSLNALKYIKEGTHTFIRSKA